MSKMTDAFEGVVSYMKTKTVLFKKDTSFNYPSKKQYSSNLNICHT